jgi:glycerol kinase
VIDAYFSATKVRWILENVRPKGDLCFGTIDAWLLWNLTGGRVHATDETNASRTMLYNISRREWDDDLLKLFKVPRAMLPEVRRSTASFGETSLFGRPIPLFGNAGDQQAALFGQGCVGKGAMKNTYGTGCFMMVNTGPRRVDSKAGLLTTLACGPKGRDGLRARGRGLHRRRGDPVSPGQPEDHREGGGDGSVGEIDSVDGRRLPGPGLRGARRARTGIRTREARSWD